MSSSSLIFSSIWMLVGSYSAISDEGIKLYMFDQDSADFKLVSGLSGISNPSFLTVSADNKFVYAVGEDEGFSSTANSIKLDLEQGTISLVNSQLTNGGAPCNITLSPDDALVITANYFGGNISLFDVLPDGSLSASDTISFCGSGVDPVRQTKPYLHCVAFTPDKKYLLANDLGTDMIHQFNTVIGADGRISIDRSSQNDIFVKAGAGPRHLCFSPDGEYIYLVSELSGEVFSFAYNSGQITQIQCIKADEYDAGGSADIHISPDGRFVYASHRLKGDGLSVLRVNSDGSLQKVGYQQTGAHPRNFAISPNGKYLLVACRDTDEIQIFQRDIMSGMLSDTGKSVRMPKPVCIKFIK